MLYVKFDDFEDVSVGEMRKTMACLFQLRMGMCMLSANGVAWLKGSPHHANSLLAHLGQE